MLDIRYIREHADEVAEKAEQKGYKVDIKSLLKLEDKRVELLQKLESNQATINEASKQFQAKQPSEMQRKKLQQTKELIAQIQEEVRENNKELFPLVSSVPNIFPDDTPLGGEEANEEIKTHGKADKADVKDHLTWAEEKGYVDFERGAKVAGHKFYYLKSKLVELDLALLQFALQHVIKAGFYPLGVPHMVNTRTLEGAGFSAKGKEKQVYKIEDEDLNLIATAEIPLTGFFADEIIPSEWLPSRMAGWSPSYRVEGGAYGKHNKGLFRTHQFNKVELYVYCKPEQSEEQHQKLLEIEEKICQELGIPYRVVRIAGGDLGAPAYKKYDVEYWSPADKAYRELMSCSNCTDYQARRLNIRYKNDQGQTEPVHTLNATAAATSRLMIAIIENHQQKNGSVAIPKSLQPYMNDQTTI